MKNPSYRKHGYKARQAKIENWLNVESRSTTELAARPRLKTSLTFQSAEERYLWTTDRGRSRLIKH